MNLRQQIVQDRIEEVSKLLDIEPDMAFLRYVHSLITTQSVHTFDDSELVDGGQDKQIDVITIEQDSDIATVYILQVKNTESFSSNCLIQMRNGLNWVFNKSSADIDTISNINFKDKIQEFRAIQRELGPSNINIHVYFVTKGLVSKVSTEFRQEEKTIRDQYDNGTYSVFNLYILGADELVDLPNSIEQKKKTIDVDIKIKYDANNPSLIKFHAGELKGVVCTASAREIAEIVNNDITGSIFDSNIRRFLGTRGAVNSDIFDTCTNSVISHQFWFLNNGITIACDSYDAITDPDNAQIKIKNIQIVNGCQTATTLALAAKRGLLAQDTRVLLRIYETPDNALVNKIVLTTNNQNKINHRDLKSNDPIQLDLERRFNEYDFYYERKPRQYDSKSDINISKIVPNELVAQSYLGIVLRKPSDARRRKYKVWGDYYEQIFGGKEGGKEAELYLLSFLIYKQTAQYLNSTTYKSSTHVTQRKIANDGVFHIARIAAYSWCNNELLNMDNEERKRCIDRISIGPNDLDKSIENGYKSLESIIEKNSVYKEDLDTALKSSSLDDEINKYIYRSTAS